MKKILITALVLLAVAAVALCSARGGAAPAPQVGAARDSSRRSAVPGETVKNSLGSLGRDLMTLDQLQSEYDRVLAENRKLRAENNGLRDLQQENNHLRDVLGYRERSSFLLVPAAVIAHDSGVWWSTVKINRGSRDGIAADMPVITDKGLVGKTTAVSGNVSEVLLVTDENCKVASKVEGTREQGICAGTRTPGGELQLTFSSKLADLQPGQKLHGGRERGIFPSGIALGTVKGFRARELDGMAVLEPAADPATLEEVFVVTGAK